MVDRLAALPRFAIVVVVCALAAATATVTLAASGGSSAAPAAPAAAPSAPQVLVVPAVRGQVYVFAKGTLEDAGFAWRVDGPVGGYAANTVVAQRPVAGTRVVDTGMPTISLRLARNSSYAQKGDPENRSPYAGSPIRLADLASVQEPAVKRAPAAKPKLAAKPKPEAAKAKAKSGTKTRYRKPDFVVPGAPREPADELALPARARALAAWVERHPDVSDANVRHWLYQHAWIVTGARFGWAGGAEALRILVGVDRKVETRWGIGSRSRDLAERALAEVSAQA